MRLHPELLAKILVPAVNLWSSTFYYTRKNFSPTNQRRVDKRPLIFAIWHDEMFPLFRLHRGEKVTAVVSASNDGEILARFMARMGFGLARGSSSRRGKQALKEAAKSIDTGHDVIFTVDGPTGPRHEVKPGAVYLAAKFNIEIVPVRVDMSKKFIFSKSWDKFQLPLPFSRIKVCYGTPYHPQIKINSREVNNACFELQKKLNLLL